jgi:hypothetical protein
MKPQRNPSEERLLAYAAGAATSLALALLVGGRVFKAMKGALGVGEWVRRGLGVLVLVDFPPPTLHRSI